MGCEVVTHGGHTGGDYHGDITNTSIALKILNEINPDVIVNLVGLADVEMCEKDPNLAYLTNVKVVENIVYWISIFGKESHLIQISTDQVYDGEGLHSEENVELKNYYSFSKFAGELAASKLASTILRVNFFGKSLSNNKGSLTDWIFSSLKSQKSIQVFQDVSFSPLSIGTLCKMIGLTIDKRIPGVFNLGSRDGMTKADFAYAFARELDLPISLLSKTTTGEVDFLKTYRPKNMKMNCLKFEQNFSVELPALLDEVRNIRGDYYETA